MASWNFPRPANASGFVDSVDKSSWLIGYNNLVHQGQRDPRHEGFLKAEGFG
jgi:hypothetical protein